MRLRLFSIVCTLVAALALEAQPDSVLLTKNFKFEDGIYLAFRDFQRNRPSLSWEEVEAQMASSAKNYLAQVAYIRRSGGDTLALDQVWGICLGGMPFVQLPATATEKEAAVFAGLRVRGRICYFTYERQKEEMVEIAAYNPLTGRPFRRGAVPRMATVTEERILNFETGRIQPFNRASLLEWIEDDRQLWRTVAELTEGEVEEKLFKCLLIYDDRNPVYLGRE